MIGDIADDANDLGRRIRAIEAAAPAEPDALPDGILVREESRCRQAIDDRDALTTPPIAGVEGPAAEKRDSERAEVLGCHVVSQDRRILRPWLRPANDVQGAVRASGAHRRAPVDG